MESKRCEKHNRRYLEICLDCEAGRLNSKEEKNVYGGGLEICGIHFVAWGSCLCKAEGEVREAMKKEERYDEFLEFTHRHNQQPGDLDWRTIG